MNAAVEKIHLRNAIALAKVNAMKLANWLEGKKQVTRVIYPGLASHPGHELMKKQSRGFGAMITFEVESSALARSILSRVKLIQFAESLGGTETLITYPATQTHADVPQEEREKIGITDQILRISTGIEGAEDLLKDLEQAFETA